jgi:ADP-glucose pyrophosphorylase
MIDNWQFTVSWLWRRTIKKLQFKAIVLAAGRGNRLGSLGQDLPKPLLHVKAEQSILEYTLLSMSKARLLAYGRIMPPRLENQSL